MFFTFALIASLAVASAETTASPNLETTPTGYRDVELFDGGSTLMEDKKDYDQMVVLGPMGFPFGIKARYLYKLNDRTSAMIGGGYGSLAVTGNDVKRLMLRAGVDYQPVGNGFHGFYVGPRVTFNKIAYDGDFGDTQNLTLIGGVAGWRTVLDPGVSIGAGLGLSHLRSTEAGVLTDRGILPMGEFTLGWAF